MFQKALRSGYLSWALRLAGSAIILWAVFSFLPLKDVTAAARSIHPLIWILSLLIFLSGHAIAAYKWRLLIKTGEAIPVFSAVRAHFAGIAANLCLPGVAGGDVVRAGLIMRNANDKSRVAFGSLIDRLLDVAGLLILGLIGAVWAFGAGALLPAGQQ